MVFHNKRIVFFINDLGSGGAEHQLVVLANGLSDRGYDVTITTFGDSLDHYSYRAKIKRDRIAPHRNKYVKLLSIWKYFLTVKTDWVISFCQRQNLMCLGALQFRPKNQIRVIAGERNTTIGKANWQERVLMEWLYERATFIVPNSYTQRNHIIRMKPKYEPKTITITNFTDLNLYSYSVLPNDSIIRIGVFSRYSYQKNCLRFVDAIKLVREKTDRQFVIEWYGSVYFKDGSKEVLYEQMLERIYAYGLQDCIKLNNSIKDVSSKLKSFTAICLPSLFEGFSNSISEAICCGRPVLVSKVSDNPVMVHEGENGFLFDPLSEESICNAFLKFFDLSYDAMHKMSIASRSIAEGLFDYNRYVGDYISLLES